MRKYCHFIAILLCATARATILTGPTLGVSSANLFVGYSTNLLIGINNEYAAGNGNYSYVPGSAGTLFTFTNKTTGWSIINEDLSGTANFEWSEVTSTNTLVGLTGNFGVFIYPTGPGVWLLCDFSGNITGASNFQLTQATNTTIVPASTTVNLYPQDNNFYISPYGTNQNAIQGTPYLKFNTLSAAMALAPSNGIFVFDSGNYNTETPTINSGSHIFGAGLMQSAYTNINDAIDIWTILGGITNVVIRGMSLPVIHINSGTNTSYATIDDCVVEGSQDGLFLTGPASIEAYNTTFKSPWDCWADYSANTTFRPWFTNAASKFYGCNFMCDQTLPGVRGPEPIVLGAGQFYMYGGTASFSGSATGHGSQCVYGDTVAKGTNGYAEFHHVTFSNVNSTGTNWIIYDPMGVRIVLDGCSANTNLIYDPSNMVSGVLSIGNTLSNVGLSATNTLTVSATGLTNSTAYTYLLSVTAGTGLVVKDQNGNEFLAPVLNNTFPLKPGWRFTGSSVTGIAVQQQ